ncbi:MAG: hypothetical protein H6Q61_761, partial [Firmicutes bacterium]|nr:hypothetical protein [Bacillota bacterium]
AIVLDSYTIPEEAVDSDNSAEKGSGKGLPVDSPSAEKSPVTAPLQVYEYSGLPGGGLDIQTYVEALMNTEGLDLNPVNSAARSVPLPDFTTNEGFALLSMANLDDENMLRVLVSWAGSTCIIRVSIVEAPRPSEGDPTPASMSTSGLSAEETVAFFQGLSPAVLGLEGEDMGAYNIYYLDGKVLVDDQPCSRVRIYAVSSPEGSNAYLGTFLVNGSRTQLYQLDLLTKKVIALNRSST